MKNYFRLLAPALLALSMLNARLSTVRAQGTAFTYQGNLNVGGAPANGYYDIRVGLFLTSSGGTTFAGPIVTSAVPVSNGLFSVTLDYGTVFDGTPYWLQISVRSNTVGSFVVLSPRQEVTPTPYAIFAEGASAAGLSGALPSSGLAGTYGGAVTFSNAADSFAGNGTGLTGVNAATLGGLGPSSFWSTVGNSGLSPAANFLGTTDNEPLSLRANNQTGLQLQYWSTGSIFTILYSGINVVGGSWANVISNNAVGATIAGGGYISKDDVIIPPFITSYGNAVTGNYGSIGGGYANLAGASGTVPGGTMNIASGAGATIGGGGNDGAGYYGNLADGQASVIAGGLGNTNHGYASTISGGFQNTANSTTSGFFYGGATVGGGTANSATTDFATVGGGLLNKATAPEATVPGGTGNTAAGIGSFAAGQYAQANNNGTFVWADGSQASFAGAGVDNAFNVLASGGVYFYNSGTGPNLSVDGGIRVYDKNILLRTDADSNHDGLGYRNTFAGFSIDGPLLWGYSGGALGTVVPDEVSLTWDYTGNVWISNNCSVATLTIRGGADVAEPFEINTEEAIPGSVVVIDEANPGKLKLSQTPYDPHVAGVVSGANGIRPGIQMQQQGLLEGGRNVALTGRVYVQADASNGPIRPGDLLTSSAIPGHAMKVTDHAKAQGAILGKAMTGLNDGKGMVLVLVTLQ